MHLRVLAAVARHESVTEAAKELHYSQPSVSHHLSRLEAATGARLIQRVGRGIRLTPAGQLLADRAAEIIGRIDAAHAELSAHVGLTAGRVRLAGFSSALGSLVPRAVAVLRRPVSRDLLRVCARGTHKKYRLAGPRAVACGSAPEKGTQGAPRLPSPLSWCGPFRIDSIPLARSRDDPRSGRRRPADPPFAASCRRGSSPSLQGPPPP